MSMVWVVTEVVFIVAVMLFAEVLRLPVMVTVLMGIFVIVPVVVHAMLSVPCVELKVVVIVISVSASKFTVFLLLRLWFGFWFS